MGISTYRKFYKSRCYFLTADFLSYLHSLVLHNILEGWRTRFKRGKIKFTILFALSLSASPPMQQG
jgi:hypothetical protein